MDPKDILGMNARNLLYVRLNSKQARGICHSKVKTKQTMIEHGIAVPQIFTILNNDEDVHNFNWQSLKDNFVIKPLNGSGGKGILVFRRQAADGSFLTTLREKYSIEDLKLHCNDILDGMYSTHTSVDNGVIIEERIPIHKCFNKFTYHGTPDVRVIVYNFVPVMAMLRLPTKESGGRANLHQGAIGVGVDIATGMTTFAVTGDGQRIEYYVDEEKRVRRKLGGIVVPAWKSVLRTAVEAAMAAELMYGGIDLFIHQEKGPLIVELNTQPGLAIQLANRTGLKKRLERVTGLNVLNSEHAIKIAQSLFQSPVVGNYTPVEERPTVNFQEDMEVIIRNKRHPTVAMMDTSRFRSCIGSVWAQELGLLRPDELLWFQNGEGGEKSPVVQVTFMLKGKKVKTAMLVTKSLNKGKIKVKLGRKDLVQFVVKG